MSNNYCVFDAHPPDIRIVKAGFDGDYITFFQDSPSFAEIRKCVSLSP